MSHPIGWLVWAARQADKHTERNVNAFLSAFFPQAEAADETKENLGNIGIKYE
ncbi:hypothetical protein AAIR98_001605 [Elusimicrobium simillimum]|uniref:hypothetical protein n=1 Tax=Elusimicrobium simillimum TaxID=3143438 RepID=UPI003C6FADB4